MLFILVLFFARIVVYRLIVILPSATEDLATEDLKDLAVHTTCDLMYWLFLDRIRDLDIL